MSAFTGATTAAQAKDRNYLQLSNSLARLSRAVGQTTDLFELLKADLDAMKVLSASHAAQFMTVAAELVPEQDTEEQDGQSQ